MVPPVVKQIWTVSGVLMNMLGHGMVLGYPSSLLPALQAPDSDIKIDIHIASWLASVIGSAGILGFLTSSLMMDWRGRKQTHILVLIPGILAWLLIYFATNVTLLMIGRFLSGISVGASVFLGAVIIGEYSSPKHRGTFLNLKTAGACLGSLISHILCNFVHWRTLALISMTPFVIALIINCTWPESPAWLASRKEYHKSEMTFYWLRGRSEESQRELYELIRSQKEKPVLAKQNSICDNITQFFMKFTRKDFIKPTIILVLCSILIETTGRHVFPAYASQIVQGVSDSRYETFYCTLAIDIIISITATFSSVLVKYFKRRSILFWTGFAAMCVLFSLCINLYLKSKNIFNGYSSVPIALLVIYFVLVNLGCTSIPIALLGELLPLAHRGAGSTVSGFMMSLSVMVSLKITPYLFNSFKVYGTFALFGVIMGLTLLLLYFLLPETKDRTLQEIEDYFNYGRFRDEKRVDSDDEDIDMKMIS